MLNIIGHIVENAKEFNVCGYYGDKIIFQTEAGAKPVKRKLKENHGNFFFNYDKKKYFIDGRKDFTLF